MWQGKVVAISGGVVVGMGQEGYRGRQVSQVVKGKKGIR